MSLLAVHSYQKANCAVDHVKLFSLEFKCVSHDTGKYYPTPCLYLRVIYSCLSFTLSITHSDTNGWLLPYKAQPAPSGAIKG